MSVLVSYIFLGITISFKFKMLLANNILSNVFRSNSDALFFPEIDYLSLLIISQDCQQFLLVFFTK